MASQNAKHKDHRRRRHPPCPMKVPDICEPYNDVRSGCSKQEGECMQLHICDHYIYGNCSFGERCQKSHNLFDPQPKAALEKCGVDVARTSKEVLADLRASYEISECPQAVAGATVANQPSGKGRRENRSKEMPDICTFYNMICGCAKGGECTRLHVCKHYVGGCCKFGRYCKRSHNIYDLQPKGALKVWGVDVARSPKHVLAELRECLTGEKAQDESDQADNVKELSVAKDSEEICVYHLCGQCHYRDHCKNHHCDLPYQWQWKLNDKWTSFNLSNNVACELTYCDPQEDSCIILQGGAIYKVDFDKFTVSGGAADMPVRRLAVKGSVYDSNHHTFVTEWYWHWLNEHLKWIPFITRGNLPPLRKSVVSDDIEMQFEESPCSSSVEFGTDEWKCKVDFTKMTSMTTSSGQERKLRRRPQFVSSDEFEKLKSQLPKRGASSSECIRLPPHWDSTDTEGNFQLIKLSKQSHPNEMGTIVKRFGESGSKRGIKTVHRIQNAELWENYSRKKHHMTTKAGTKVKELLLFHGTAGKYVDHICEQGFDWRICGLSVGTRYGKGSYFARDSSYSRRFTDDNRILAVHVLVGEYCVGRDTYVRPPPKDKDDPLGPMFDACVDCIENPEIFVVFSTDQAYPAYVIEYD